MRDRPPKDPRLPKRFLPSVDGSGAAVVVLADDLNLVPPGRRNLKVILALTNLLYRFK